MTLDCFRRGSHPANAVASRTLRRVELECDRKNLPACYLILSEVCSVISPPAVAIENISEPLSLFIEAIGENLPVVSFTNFTSSKRKTHPAETDKVRLSGGGGKRAVPLHTFFATIYLTVTYGNDLSPKDFLIGTFIGLIGML
ncbi:hypothetical protein [Bremerella sp.]|uniref:hypothetical protein n=1 Tax=Bremerella sp. TaxID=2795602 RepID=UPI00391C7D6A